MILNGNNSYYYALSDLCQHRDESTNSDGSSMMARWMDDYTLFLCPKI